MPAAAFVHNLLQGWRPSTPAPADAPLFARLRQVCTVTGDLEGTLRNLVEHLGIGPFRCWHFRPPVLYARTFRGRPGDFTMKLAITWLDDVQWEVIQPVDGASLYREHLDAHGPGVQHLLMDTGAVPFAEAARRLAAKGHGFAQTARINPPLQVGAVRLPSLPRPLARPANLAFGYVDGEATLRTCIEVTRYPLGASERFALRAGRAERCVPAGDSHFERPLPGRRVRRLVKVGIVTRDLEATARAYLDVGGVGPWRVRELGDGALGHLAVVGAKAPFRARAAWALLDDVLFEIVEPREGESPYHEILRTRGEGVAVLGVLADGSGGYRGLVDHCRSLGYPVLMEGSLAGGPAATTFAARRFLGTDIEVIDSGAGRDDTGRVAADLFTAIQADRTIGG